MTEKTRFNISVLLPEIPDEHDACARRLSDMLLEHKGIEKAHNHQGEGVLTPDQFCVHFDPNYISLQKVRSLVKSVGAELDHRYGHLLLKAAPMNARQARKTRLQLEKFAGIVDAGVSIDGAIRIEFDKHITNDETILLSITTGGIDAEVVSPHRARRQFESGLAKTDQTRILANHQHPHGHAHTGILGERSELIFSLMCGVFLLVGWTLNTTLNLSLGMTLPIYLTAYFLGGFFMLKESVEKLLLGRFEIDFLMLVAAIGAAVLGQWAEGALLLFLFSFSHSLEHYAMGRARRAIEALSDLAPETAVVRRKQELEEIHTDDLVIGDVVIVKPNQRIAADGFVVKGNSSVDESPITGESLPVDKQPVGDSEFALKNESSLADNHRVFAGTINQSGAMEIQVTRLASESTLARVIVMVNEAETRQSMNQRFAERFERIFVPSVLVFVGILPFAWVVVDEQVSDSFYRAMAVLVAASPCALAISTPSAVLCGVARAARGGVLIKGGAPLENLGVVKFMAFDKTGTLTEGRPRLTDIIAAEESSEIELLETAIAVESLSDHPLASAIVRDGRESLNTRRIRESNSQQTGKTDELSAAQNFQSITGRGVHAEIDGQKATVGTTEQFADSSVPEIPQAIRDAVERLEKAGRTTMIVQLDVRYLGVLGVMDSPREAARETLQKLRDLGIEQMIMLSGDSRTVAETVAREVGIDETKGGLMPAEKVDSIRELSKMGAVAMIGDGVNDAPAMAHATVGVAMGAAGSDVALETADIALMSDDLRHLPFAVGLSRMTNRIVRQNLWMSLGMVAILIPATLFGLRMGPAVVLHESSTLVVVANALRLLAYGQTRKRATRALDFKG